MEKVVAVIVIVFILLQIILFFKLWGMTNNVKSIRNKDCFINDDYYLKYKYHKYLDNAEQAFINNNQEAVSVFLEKALLVLLKSSSYKYTKASYSHESKKKIQEFKELYYDLYKVQMKDFSEYHDLGNALAISVEYRYGDVFVS